jgi:hypothetical protein
MLEQVELIDDHAGRLDLCRLKGRGEGTGAGGLRLTGVERADAMNVRVRFSCLKRRQAPEASA